MTKQKLITLIILYTIVILIVTAIISISSISINQVTKPPYIDPITETNNIA